jgi:hypothetical protein
MVAMSLDQYWTGITRVRVTSEEALAAGEKPGVFVAVGY